MAFNWCEQEGDGANAEPDIEPPFTAQNVRKEEAKEVETQKQIIAKRFKKIFTRIPIASRNSEGPSGVAENQTHDEVTEGSASSKRQNIIKSIKIPLVSVFPKKLSKEPKELVGI